MANEPSKGEQPGSMSPSYRLLRRLSRLAPRSVRAWIRGRVDVSEYHRHLAAEQDPYAGDDPVCLFPESPCTLGILRETRHYHKSYVAACREMRISYKLLDISVSDWMRVVEESGCDAFLVWPSVESTVWKDMCDDRLRIMEEDLGLVLYPTLKETWLYENKRRVRDWLAAHRIDAPRTWVFYDRREAEEFVRGAELPLVLKTNLGASASGVQVLRDRGKALRVVRRALTRGIVPRGRNPRDRQWGSVYLQEYLPNVKEWRMVRIGDSYFGYRKEQVGDFHSGSHAWSWLDPPRPLLEKLREVTEKGGFTSMNVDVFETEDGRLLVNELQTVFGATTPVDQLRVDGKPGRYVVSEQTGEWVFEEGDFSRNACANERIRFLLSKVLKT